MNKPLTPNQPSAYDQFGNVTAHSHNAAYWDSIPKLDATVEVVVNCGCSGYPVLTVSVPVALFLADIVDTEKQPDELSGASWNDPSILATSTQNPKPHKPHQKYTEAHYRTVAANQAVGSKLIAFNPYNWTSVEFRKQDEFKAYAEKVKALLEGGK